MPAASSSGLSWKNSGPRGICVWEYVYVFIYIVFPQKHGDGSCGLIIPFRSRGAERENCRRQGCTWWSSIISVQCGEIWGASQVLGGGDMAIWGLSLPSPCFYDSETGHHRIYGNWQLAQDGWDGRRGTHFENDSHDRDRATLLTAGSPNLSRGA